MKKLTLFLLLAVLSFETFSQKLTDPEYYISGEIKTRSFYDSTSQKYTTTQYYCGGKPAQIKILEKDGFTFIDTVKAFYTTGKVAYTACLKASNLTGPLTVFYPDGTIKRQSYYFNSFQTGVWTEYFENGKKKSEGKYLMSAKDSADSEDPKFTDNKRMLQDTISYPSAAEMDSIDSAIKVKSENGDYSDCILGSTDSWTIISTPKDGIWKYWDEKGKLLSEEKYVKGTLIKKKK